MALRNTNRSAAFVCPFRVSARSSLPTRTGHTKVAPSHRAGQPARKATRKVRCLFLRSDVIPGSSYRRNRKCRPHSPTAISPCASPNTNRSAVFNPSGSRRIRADLVPVGFNTAPSQRAGDRRSNRYAAFGHSIVFSMTIPLRSALSWNLL